MSKSIDNIDKLIEDLDKEVDEASVTGGVAGYETPYAFSDGSKEDEEERDENAIKSTGYKVVGENMSKFKKIMLGEISYQTYKKDPELSSKQKVNTSIKEINKRLYQIERIIAHAQKLKNEEGINSGQYWKSTNQSLRKISERLLKISNRTRNMD